MKIKQTIRSILLGGFLLIPVAVTVFPAPATYAETKCGGVDTAIISCGGNKDSKDPKDSGLWQILLIAINILTAGVGLAALGGIVYGAILYTSAGGSAEQVKKARGIFMNVVIGIVAFAAMWGLLNFIIPGGVF